MLGASGPDVAALEVNSQCGVTGSKGKHGCEATPW